MKTPTNLQGIVMRQLSDQDGNPLPLFRENWLWRFLYSYFGIDARISLLTGLWTLKPIKANTITAKGKSIAAKRLAGLTATAVTAIAIGTGTPGANALGAEITTGGGSRGAADTPVSMTTTTTDDTVRYVKTFTFTVPFAITENGLFDNNVSGGNMAASQHYAAVNVQATWIYTITHDIIVS